MRPQDCGQGRGAAVGCAPLALATRGAFAALVRQRFKVACRRLGLEERHDLQLPTHLFQRPARSGAAAAAGQLTLDF